VKRGVVKTRLMSRPAAAVATRVRAAAVATRVRAAAVATRVRAAAVATRVRAAAMTAHGLVAVGATLLAAMLPGAATAQAYPNRPVRIIVPYGVGGASDVLARVLGAKLQIVWGQGVVVENRTGASGNIGTEVVVKSAPDGYTLALENVTMVINPGFLANVPFDVQKDLTPVALLGATPKMLAAHPSLNVSTLRELTDYARLHPGQLAYGSCGPGTPQHLAMELYLSQAGLSMVHTPYKGCAPALADLLGGQIPLAMLSANMVAPHLPGGRLKALAVTSRKRYRLAPEVPSFDELGYRGYDLWTWYALMGPAGLPREVVDKLYADTLAAVSDPEVHAQLLAAGVEDLRGDGAALAALMKADQAKYAQLVRRAHIKAE
jgi:tripartite-type tricarboxylate transporter receptor subunit TctC